MDHLANSTAELRQGGKDWYVGCQGIPVNKWPWEKCEPVVVVKSGNLSVSFESNRVKVTSFVM